VTARNLAASRDVDALDAVGGEFGRVFLELGPVGGERELVERSTREVARERGDERHDAAPDQRLKQSLKLDLVHVPFNGGGLAVVSVLAGHTRKGALPPV